MSTLIGIGKYRREDYEEILNISSDRNSLDATWEDWSVNQRKAKKRFKGMGLKVVDIIVKPHELVAYCRKRGLDVNGESRAQFITEKTQLLNK